MRMQKSSLNKTKNRPALCASVQKSLHFIHLWSGGKEPLLQQPGKPGQGAGLYLPPTRGRFVPLNRGSLLSWRLFGNPGFRLILRRLGTPGREIEREAAVGYGWDAAWKNAASFRRPDEKKLHSLPQLARGFPRSAPPGRQARPPGRAPRAGGPTGRTRFG